MATAKQSEVKWVPKDKKTGKGGFLALRSNPTKPFSGTVTGIKKGTTTASGGKAVYSGGRNVAATAKRSQKSSGSSAAAGTTAKKETYKPGQKANKNIGYTAGSSKTSGASGTPLLAASETRRGLTTRSGATDLSGLPRGATKPKTFANKPMPKRGEKRSFSGVVKVWDGKAWVPFKK